MSTHPNVILLLCLKPDDMPVKTMRAIKEAAGAKPDADEIKIAGNDYNIQIMTSSYDDGNQIAADEHDIIVYDLVTYGYGERIAWADLEKRRNDLAAWANEIAPVAHVTPSIFVTANYW